MRLDSAPELDTLPISSWLKSAMQLTFPSKEGKYWELALSASASTAQNLSIYMNNATPDVSKSILTNNLNSRTEII